MTAWHLTLWNQPGPLCGTWRVPPGWVCRARLSDRRPNTCRRSAPPLLVCSSLRKAGIWCLSAGPPEPLRAYLSGLLRGVNVTWRVAGLNVSLLNATLTPAQATTLRPLFSSAGLNPRVLVREDRRVALVDVVASGGTFSALHRALRDWACEDARRPQCIERRVQVTGLLRSAAGRPRAWRWSAQPQFQGVQTRSVLIDWRCWQWLAEEGVKVAPHHPPACWVNTPAGLPERHPDRLEALGQARALYLLAQTRTERAAAAAELATAGGLRVAALRSLMAAWQSGAASGRPECRGQLPVPWCG
ncbi:phosphoribosyltransferase [Deinococcus taeanensis]|uniref:phosphoribosyltransferase n=1 Tax=Deinococcus taeanensis TaxID=2737050 RepID=UPI001CDCEF7D|nr:phosphoribosyltransferase [Deinococcus taeanensis]UBV43357.1 phosphoribosyltransferase [Deinococcus taeanensis]